MLSKPKQFLAREMIFFSKESVSDREEQIRGVEDETYLTNIILFCLGIFSVRLESLLESLDWGFDVV